MKRLTTITTAQLVALIALAAMLIVGRYQLHFSSDQLRLDVTPTTISR